MQYLNYVFFFQLEYSVLKGRNAVTRELFIEVDVYILL